MAPEIHCSACDALVQHGNQFCPGCGLQLTAVATPAVYVEGPRFSVLTILLMAVGALVLLCYLATALSK